MLSKIDMRLRLEYTHTHTISALLLPILLGLRYKLSMMCNWSFYVLYKAQYTSQTYRTFKEKYECKWDKNRKIRKKTLLLELSENISYLNSNERLHFTYKHPSSAFRCHSGAPYKQTHLHFTYRHTIPSLIGMS